MAKFSGNPSLYYSKYPWKELGVSVFNPSAQGYFQKLGWDECKWDNECSHPDTTSWDLLDGTKKHAAEMLGFEEKTWNAPSANDGWAYTYPLEEYFRNYQWSSMLSYEQELFTCLGWNEAIFDDHDKQPDDWSQQWDDLPIVKQICATAIGYHRPRWNSKIVMYEWKSLVNHLANDLCIELKNSDTANGNAVVVSTCNGNPNQKWYIDLFGRIRSKINMNKCIDAGNSNQLYVKLFISTCNDQAGQKWVVESNGRIRSEPYNKYIGVSGGCGGVSAGSRLELHARFEGNPNCASQHTWIHDEWRP
ncbi:MAG: ricin-type beta-trefoil lectin domain protein, partial [Candidatus Nanopelagicales bacterium]